MEVVVPQPAVAALDGFPPDLTEAFEPLIGMVTASGNWRVRKKAILDLLDLLEVSFDASRETGTAEAAGSDDPEPDLLDDDEEDAEDGEPVIEFADIAPVVIAAILERIGDTRIEGPEQAAFHLLSSQSEHRSAAVTWIESEFRHARAVRKLARTDRRLADWFKSIPALEQDQTEIDED